MSVKESEPEENEECQVKPVDPRRCSCHSLGPQPRQRRGAARQVYSLPVPQVKLRGLEVRTAPWVETLTAVMRRQTLLSFFDDERPFDRTKKVAGESITQKRRWPYSLGSRPGRRSSVRKAVSSRTSMCCCSFQRNDKTSRLSQ